MKAFTTGRWTGIFRRISRLLWAVFALSLSACSIAMQSTPPPEVARAQDLGKFPYAPLLYHLDLSILAYQIYSQTLVWPHDPFYEEFSDTPGKRNAVMAQVHNWAQARSAAQVQSNPRLGGYRGPGVLGGFPNNSKSDPIITRYDTFRPWQSSIFNASGRWTEYTPPTQITDKIASAHMCFRATGGRETNVIVAQVAHHQGATTTGGRDVLLAFEGATGDKGEKGQPANQSMLGFVLFRNLPGMGSEVGQYDVHIAFRGSRSGNAARAATKANFTKRASGNPDWVTDLGWTRIGADAGGGPISTVGAVHRGFARSMTQTLPRIIRCLEQGAAQFPGKTPRNIYATGHSLGGGLAQHFTSAVLLGNLYGPDGQGAYMPAALRKWPWSNIKLITYGAPRAGDSEWARKLTEDGLQSEVFDTALLPIDLDALAVHDPSIRPRLIDPMRPAGFRVLITTDPISTQKFNNGKHVGKSVYVNDIGAFSPLAIGKFNSHEPEEIRRGMIEKLGDERNPPAVVRYREIPSLTPDFDRLDRGSTQSLNLLQNSIEGYVAKVAPLFNLSRLRRDFQIMVTEILPAE